MVIGVVLIELSGCRWWRPPFRPGGMPFPHPYSERHTLETHSADDNFV